MMHLADSALPVGGFAFSSGLEAAVKSGMVSTHPSLIRYLKGVLKQWGAFELPFIGSFYNDGSPELLLRYDRMLLTQTMRKASIDQARGWRRVFSDFFPALDTAGILARFADAGAAVHYVPLYALSLKIAGATEMQVKELSLFTQVRDQVSAAVRLGLIGPSAAQSIQSEVEQEIGAIVAASENKKSDDARRSTPVMDIVQMLHPMLYTKLFQN
jgi:urease accessory protein